MQIKHNLPSGVPEDYNLGKFFLDYLKANPEDHVWQIDAGTGEVEMKSSVKSRSIRLARCFQKCGLQPGDVLVVSGRNHLDVHIPFYAAYMTGLPLAGLDPAYKIEEIKHIFRTASPKMAICEAGSYNYYMDAAKELGMNVKVITFGEGTHSLAKFQELYDNGEPEEEFKVATFDTSKVYAWLISTSGTTGLPKIAAFTHQTIIQALRLFALLKEKKIDNTLNMSSVQWISSYFASLSMISGNHIKVQTSAPDSIEHIIDIINKYRPVISIGSAGMIPFILNHEKYCDLTCFNRVVVTGVPARKDALTQLKTRLRSDAEIWNLFAQTECVGGILVPAPNGPVGNVGKEHEMIKVQLVDPQTGDIVTEPHKTGELWTKGPRFTEYYNNPQATADAITKDGWYKTGDLLYKDENGYYFFVERKTLAFRVRRQYVLPMEIEEVIRTHKGVADVCVVPVPDKERGKQAKACVVPRPGAKVTAEEIKDLVASKLSIDKQLHGGVLFISELPKTATGKVARVKVMEVALNNCPTVEDVNTELPCSGTVKKLITTFQELGNSCTTRYVSAGRF